ncbi:MAG: hypothetical protein ABUL72_03235 [Armatimonadota bacterium]
MRTLLILACAAVATGAVALTAMKLVTKKPTTSKASVTTPKKEGLSGRMLVADIVDRLHPNLAARFGTTPTDQRFGIERAPEQYHIQEGVINPTAAHNWEKGEKEREGAKFKPLGTDQLPTDKENALIAELRDTDFNFEVYTVGLPEKPNPDDGEVYARFRGPVGDLEHFPEDAAYKELLNAGIAVNAKGSPDSIDSTSKDGKAFFKAKSIHLTEDRCIKCHQGVKVGEKVGAIVYKYWPRDKTASL